MKINMKNWIKDLGKTKKAFPILSFPSTSLLNVSVKDLVTSASLQANAMKAVADRVDEAGAVSFMDLSVEAECFGSTIRFSDDEVPTVVGAVVSDEEEANALTVPAVGSARSGIYVEAIKLASQMITDKPIIAGMIGPFSLGARLMEVSEIMMQCYDEPEVVHTVLEKTTEFLIEYAKAYKNAGANGIMVAEPVAGLLSPSLEEEFSAPYMKKIVSAVQDDNFAVIYHNCGNNTPMMIKSISSIGAMAYHFGNSIDLKVMLKAFDNDVAVMGNIDPAGVLKMGNPQEVYEKTRALILECKDYENFIVSSGCDIPPQTPWENIDAFFKAVKDTW